jgi:hypothetical protein
MDGINVVFLDLDFVLNNTSFLQAAHKEVFGDKPRAVRADDHKKLCQANIDPKAVSLLNDLLEKSEAKVVIHSSWKENWTMTEILVFLQNKGFKGEVIGMTQSLPENMKGCVDRRRAFEIANWLVESEKTMTVKSMVILDDEEIGLGFDECQVRTDPINGLTQFDVDKAVKILAEENRA